jgi:hypothetical protein
MKIYVITEATGHYDGGEMRVERVFLDHGAANAFADAHGMEVVYKDTDDPLPEGYESGLKRFYVVEESYGPTVRKWSDGAHHLVQVEVYAKDEKDAVERARPRLDALPKVQQCRKIWKLERELEKAREGGR